MRLRRVVKKLFGRRRKGQKPAELSTPTIHRAILRAIQKAAPAGLAGDCLDVGSGAGELLTFIRERYGLRSFACDYTDRLMRIRDQPVAIADLNSEPLPFENNRFALVTCIETIEHLENYREIIREIYRVLQPGGAAIISTPNILNLRSRLRYLSSGFYNLFGPLAPDEPNIHSTRGHINPVNWFYLAHALLSAGFGELRATVDKYQRRSFPAFALLILPVRIGNWIVYRRDEKKYHTIDEKNAETVQAMNSRDLLLGRTLIVSAVKPR